MLLGGTSEAIWCWVSDRDLTEPHKAALRLHVCGTAYDFSDGGGPFVPHLYLWRDDLDWEVLASRTLYFSLPPNNAASGTPAVSGHGRRPRRS